VAEVLAQLTDADTRRTKCHGSRAPRSRATVSRV
jgi:hypothetical protein